MKRNFIRVSLVLAMLGMMGTAFTFSACSDDDNTEIAELRPEGDKGTDPSADGSGINSIIPTIAKVEADQQKKTMTISGTNLDRAVKITVVPVIDIKLNGVDYKAADKPEVDITSTIVSSSATEVVLGLFEGKVTLYFDKLDATKRVTDGGFGIPVPEIKEFTTDFKNKTMTITGTNLKSVISVKAGKDMLIDSVDKVGEEIINMALEEVSDTKMVLPLWDGKLTLRYDLNNPGRVVENDGFTFPIPTFTSVKANEAAKTMVVTGTNFDYITELTIAGKVITIPQGSKTSMTLDLAVGKMSYKYDFNEGSKIDSYKGYAPLPEQKKDTEGYCLKITQSEKEANPWDSGIEFVWDVDMENNTDYVIEYKVFATQSDAIFSNEISSPAPGQCKPDDKSAHDGKADWQCSYSSESNVAVYGPTGGAKITEGWQTVTVNVKTLDKAHDGYSFAYTKLRMGLGNLVGDCYIDDIKIYKKGDTKKRSVIPNASFADDISGITYSASKNSSNGSGISRVKISEQKNVPDQPSDIVTTLVPLTAKMYNSWKQGQKVFDQSVPVEKEGADCSYGVGEASGLPYGNGSVKAFLYADLTAYKTLHITVEGDGIPRVMMNREADDALSSYEGSKFLQFQTAEAYTVVENEDKTKTYILDLEAIVKTEGYAHLNAIKGANGASIKVTKFEVEKVAGDDEDADVEDDKVLKILSEATEEQKQPHAAWTGGPTIVGLNNGIKYKVADFEEYENAYYVVGIYKGADNEKTGSGFSTVKDLDDNIWSADNKISDIFLAAGKVDGEIKYFYVPIKTILSKIESDNADGVFINWWNFAEGAGVYTITIEAEEPKAN